MDFPQICILLGNIDGRERAEEPGEGDGYCVMGGKGIPTGKHPPARRASWCQI